MRCDVADPANVCPMQDVSRTGILDIPERSSQLSLAAESDVLSSTLS